MSLVRSLPYPHCQLHPLFSTEVCLMFIRLHTPFIFIFPKPHS